MKPINKELVLELYPQHDNLEDRTNAYNTKTGENRTTSTLRKIYSRRKPKDNEELHNSNKYQEVATDKAVTKEELLEMHGYDSYEWELT